MCLLRQVDAVGGRHPRERGHPARLWAEGPNNPFPQAAPARKLLQLHSENCWHGKFFIFWYAGIRYLYECNHRVPYSQCTARSDAGQTAPTDAAPSSVQSIPESLFDTDATSDAAPEPDVPHRFTAERIRLSREPPGMH